MKRTIPNLKAGQLVSIINTVGYYVIVSRAGTNLYVVNFKGREITVQRQHLAPKPE